MPTFPLQEIAWGARRRAPPALVAAVLLMSVGCADRSPGNVRTVTPGTPETLVGTCSPCSERCVFAYGKRCTQEKVHSEKAKSGGCLVSCVGQPEKGEEGNFAPEGGDLIP